MAAPVGQQLLANRNGGSACTGSDASARRAPRRIGSCKAMIASSWKSNPLVTGCQSRIAHFGVEARPGWNPSVTIDSSVTGKTRLRPRRLSWQGLRTRLKKPHERNVQQRYRFRNTGGPKDAHAGRERNSKITVNCDLCTCGRVGLLLPDAPSDTLSPRCVKAQHHLNSSKEAGKGCVSDSRHR